MTDQELETIESELGVTLPLEFRLLASNPPPGFRKSLAADWLFSAAPQVVNATRRYRIQGLGEINFPPDHVVIAETGTGDFFCLDLSQDPSPVVEFDHERGQFKTVAFSFTSFVKQLSRQR